MHNKRVLVAMSGGVDSSVTAYLLKSQGYECVGATMRLTCPAPDPATGMSKVDRDIADAKAVAERLGIPHHVLDLQQTFDRNVIERFMNAYQEGLTPNPCIICNRHIKFGALLDAALDMGCDYIATGHYAKTSQAADGTWQLHRGEDPKKDQSYFLYSLTQERLAHTIFPLAGLDKERDVRRIAAEQCFINAKKAESEDICFIADDWGAASSLFLSALRTHALENGHDVITCYCPLSPHSKIDHLLIPGLGLAFMTENRFHNLSGLIPDRRIHAKRFLDIEVLRRHKKRLSFNQKAASQMIRQAVTSLAENKALHDELESIYLQAMDFSMMDSVLESVVAQIVDFRTAREGSLLI